MKDGFNADQLNDEHTLVKIVTVFIFLFFAYAAHNEAHLNTITLR